MASLSSLAGTLTKARNLSTEDYLAQNYKDDWAIVSPYLKELLQEEQEAVNSTALVDAAKKQIQRSAMGTDESMNARQQSRAGVNLTPSQQLAMTSSNNQSAATNNTANMNTARLNQYENNVNALNRLIATTNAMKTGSASTLSTIAQNESSRRTANAQAKAASKQATYSTIGSAAGLALAAAAIF